MLAVIINRLIWQIFLPTRGLGKALGSGLCILYVPGSFIYFNEGFPSVGIDADYVRPALRTFTVRSFPTHIPLVDSTPPAPLFFSLLLVFFCINSRTMTTAARRIVICARCHCTENPTFPLILPPTLPLIPSSSFQSGIIKCLRTHWSTVVNKKRKSGYARDERFFFHFFFQI